MATVKQGDRVRIIRREPTDEEIKNATYLSFFGGLTGSVAKVYNPMEVAVEVEQESLTTEVRKRHLSIRDQMKTKWLDGLSEEGRGKLTEREKDFHLRYVLLVASNDLEKIGAAKPAETPKPAAPAAPPTLEEVAAARKSLQDFEAAEIAELERRAKQS
jgi:hypothetical protein